MPKEIKALIVIADSGIKKHEFEFQICFSLKEARQIKKDWQGFDLGNVEIHFCKISILPKTIK